MSALHDFIAESNDVEGLRELLRRGENPDSEDDSGLTPLHIVVLKSERNPRDTDELLLVARELISFGANVDKGNIMEETPLHFAVVCRNCKMIEFLLKSKAEINRKDINGYAALHFSTSCIKLRGIQLYDLELGVVKLLLKFNAFIDIPALSQETPLMLAAQSNSLYIVRELLKNNASVNLQDSLGNSAMHYALNNTEVNVDVVLELRRQGCSFSIPNFLGESPQTTYFTRLFENQTRAEVEKAKHVIKLFMFDGCSFNSFQLQCVKEINKKNCQLSRFLDSSYNEIMQMHHDKIAGNYSVHAIAMRGIYGRAFVDDNHIPFEVYDKVLDKLIRRQYTAYSDLIAAGICRPYMRNKFAEKCCFMETGNKCSDFDALYLLSSYLSQLDMLNIMILCYERECRQRTTFVSRFRHLTRCSIS